jgi:NIMA (never in mitosis gene a)-related kinase
MQQQVPQTTTIKDFQVLNKLGEGAYSQVYKVLRYSDRQTYALKKVIYFFILFFNRLI